MAEITSTGFVGKTENEYFQEERDLYLSIDSDWLLDPSTPDGLKIALDSEIFANLDEQAQLAYNSKDPNKARGLDLDTLCFITGTIRNPATASVVTLNLTGTNGTSIPQGKRVKDVVTGELWATDTPVTIVGTTAIVTASAVNKGIITTDAGDISVIVDAVSGWQTVTNPAAQDSTGTNQETDADLRLRRNNEVARPGSNQVDSMLGNILEVDDVTEATIYENFTGSVDANGVPAHSLAILVVGGADGSVAQAIYRKKNPGVGLFGAGTPVVVVVKSEVPGSNSTTTITFGRPTNVPITYDVTVQNDGTLPLSTIEAEIKENVVSYAAGGEISPDCGFNNAGFGIGEDVTYSRMYTPVNQVIGSYGNSYVTTLTINGGTSNIAIDFDEISQWTEANVNVTIL